MWIWPTLFPNFLINEKLEERIFSTFFQLKMSEILLTNHHMTFGMTRWSQAEMAGKKVYRHTRKVVMFRIQTSEIEGGRKPRVNRSQAYTWVNFVTVTLTNRQFRDFRIIPSSSKIKIHNFSNLVYVASETWSSEIKIHKILRNDFLQCEKNRSFSVGLYSRTSWLKLQQLLAEGFPTTFSCMLKPLLNFSRLPHYANNPPFSLLNPKMRFLE